MYEYRDEARSSDDSDLLHHNVHRAPCCHSRSPVLYERPYWRGAAVLVLLLFLYPITLSKLTLLTPHGLSPCGCLQAFSCQIDRHSVAAGAAARGGIVDRRGRTEGGTVFFRRQLPDHGGSLGRHGRLQSTYFSTHDLTYFCQIWILKPIMHCPYQDQLSVVMEKGLRPRQLSTRHCLRPKASPRWDRYLRRFRVFLCGLVIALGNRVSAGIAGSPLS